MLLEGSVGGEVEVHSGGEQGTIGVKISAPDSPDEVSLELRGPDGELLFRLTPQTDLKALTQEEQALLALSEPILELGGDVYDAGRSYPRGEDVARRLGGTLSIGRNEEITVEVDKEVAQGLGGLFSRR